MTDSGHDEDVMRELKRKGGAALRRYAPIWAELPSIGPSENFDQRIADCECDKPNPAGVYPYCGDHVLKALAIVLQRDIYQLNPPTLSENGHARPLVKKFSQAEHLHGTTVDGGFVIHSFAEMLAFDRVRHLLCACHSRHNAGSPIIISHNGLNNLGAHYETSYSRRE